MSWRRNPGYRGFSNFVQNNIRNQVKGAIQGAAMHGRTDLRGANRGSNVSLQNMESISSGLMNLRLKHTYSTFQSDAGGLFSTSGFFSPDLTPGWSTIGSLFNEFRPKSSTLNLLNFQGYDADGVISVRVTDNPSETIESNLDGEMERGAKLYTVSRIPATGLKIDLLPAKQTDIEATEWQLWNATTPYGDAKEYGQVFIRGDGLGATTNFLKSFTETSITFRSLKNL